MPEMEDLSVEEILKSIRHILSEEKEESSSTREDKECVPVKMEEKVIPRSDVFVLTEEMRVQEKPLFSQEDLKEQHRPMGGILQDKMQKHLSSDSKKEQLEIDDKCIEIKLMPLLQKWLDEHLSDIVERVVEKEVKSLLRR